LLPKSKTKLGVDVLKQPASRTVPDVGLSSLKPLVYLSYGGRITAKAQMDTLAVMSCSMATDS
jgi:hypothetical protein